MEIFILPAFAKDPFWTSFEHRMDSKEPLTMIVEMSTGSKAVIDWDGQFIDHSNDFPDEVKDAALSQMRRRSRAEAFEWENKRYLIDTMRPSERLVITGAGHDALPVADLAVRAGFQVTILDPREMFNHESRFPGAVRMVAEPSDMNSEQFRNHWWIIMNHHLSRDEESLHLALHSEPKFIGVLSPLSRTEKILLNIEKRFVDGPIFALVGLDLAAETAEEVAISIVSQLLAIRNERNAGALWKRQDSCMNLEHCEWIQQETQGKVQVRVIHNEQYVQGMSGSVKAGIRAAAFETKAVFVFLADQPFVQRKVLV